MKPFLRILVTTALFGLLIGQNARAETVNFAVAMTPAQEVPAVNGPGKGTIAATLDTASGHFTWKINYSNLSGPVSAGHFHGPAGAMEKAGVALGLKGNLSSPIQGEAMLSPEQVKEVLAGKWYVNLHTDAHPSGELRGQLIR